MPDYKEAAVLGKQWQRCSQIIIDNPQGGVPRIMMREERVVAFGGEVVRTELGIDLEVPFDPAEAIELFDQVDGKPRGKSITVGEVYEAIWSLYSAKAKARDERGKPVSKPPVPG